MTLTARPMKLHLSNRLMQSPGACPEFWGTFCASGRHL